jgi:hypothetical protein
MRFTAPTRSLCQCTSVYRIVSHPLPQDLIYACLRLKIRVTFISSKPEKHHFRNKNFFSFPIYVNLSVIGKKEKRKTVALLNFP